MRPIRLLALALAGVALAGCPVPTSGMLGAGGSPGWRWPWEGGSSYRYQGAAVYEGKALAAVQAEFDQLSLSPSGRHVAFRGRETNNEYWLYLGEVGGNVRKVLRTGLEPQRITWNQDETVLTYLCMEVDTSRPYPPGIPPKPMGYALFQASIYGGEPRKLPDVPNIRFGFLGLSPAADRLVAVGGKPGAEAMPLDVIDLATGAARQITGGDVHTPHLVTWRPDGKAFAFVMFEGQPPSKPTVGLAGEPDWAIGRRFASGAQQAMALQWASDGTTLVGYFLDESGDLVVHRLAPDAKAPETTKVALGRSPATMPYQYDACWPAPDGRRVLVRRAVTEYPAEGGVRRLVPPESLILTPGSTTMPAVGGEMTPVGWLNDKQVLFYAGSEQDKRLVVVEVPGS